MYWVEVFLKFCITVYSPSSLQNFPREFIRDKQIWVKHGSERGQCIGSVLLGDQSLDAAYIIHYIKHCPCQSRGIFVLCFYSPATSKAFIIHHWHASTVCTLVLTADALSCRLSATRGADWAAVWFLSHWTSASQLISLVSVRKEI